MKIEWSGGKLTKKQALFLCWKLWEWLAETGERKKEKWPHWEWNGGEVEAMKCECPCCEYTWRQFSRRDCNLHCPLKTLWPEGCLRTTPKLTPFQKWRQAKTRQTRKKYALIIANGAKKEYMKLQKERR